MSFITLHGMMHQVYYTHLQEEYTETYTRFYNGETGSLAHCTYNSEWNILLSFLGSRLFSVLYFHLLFLLSIGLFFFSLHISIIQFTPSLHQSVHPKNYMEARKFPFFLFLMSSRFTNTTCIETLHRPICFLFFFFISEYNFFLSFFNSLHEPATYVHNAIL